MIDGTDVSSAYRSMLQDTLSRRGLPQVTRVTNPIMIGEVNIDTEIHTRFRDFEFPDGRTGGWWIQDRIIALLRQKGEYWKPMRRKGQLSYVLKALKKMREGGPRWNANRLLITLFDPSNDLHRSRAPTPPYLVTLDFKPVRDQLSLIGTLA